MYIPATETLCLVQYIGIVFNLNIEISFHYMYEYFFHLLYNIKETTFLSKDVEQGLCDNNNMITSRKIGNVLKLIKSNIKAYHNNVFEKSFKTFSYHIKDCLTSLDQRTHMIISCDIIVITK